jgi:putative GTP pyrophosphokinase
LASLDNPDARLHASRGRMSHDAILLEFDDRRDRLHERAEELRAQIASWLAAAQGLKVHSVTARVKSRASLAGKLARPDRSYRALWNVTDLVGLRVITYFEDDVDRVGQIVEGALSVRFADSVDTRSRRDAGAFGYRSLHYVCAMGGGLPDEAHCELQVRSVLDHAWAEIEHDLGYKSRDAVPVSTRRRLHRLAGLLELADQEFVAIRRELDEYARVLPQKLAGACEGDDVPLDRVSLEPLLDCEEIASADGAVARALAMELGDEPFHPDYLIRMLASSGITTAGAARRGVRTHSEAIEAMVRPYFAFASREWKLSPGASGRILRGYSLFFLAHAVVLHSPSLGIDKVERLTRLYRELDYPDDERAAQHVASMLVDAFAALA